MNTFYIDNVDCANCAAKIENHIRNKTDIKEVQINLISSKISVDSNKYSAEDLQHLANEVENGVVIYSKKVNYESTSIMNKELIGIFISMLLLVLGLTTDNISFYLVGYVIVGYPVIKLAFKNMLQLRFFDEYFLMTLATFAAIGINEFAEALAVMLFYSVGEYIQEKTLDKTKETITKLAKLNVRDAILIKGNKTQVVDTEEIVIGDKLLVPSGERIPVDSKLISEVAYIDTSHITGESEAVSINTGQDLLAGSVNKGNEIEIEAIATADDSMIAKLIELVTYAETKKTKTEQFMTRFSKVYTPIVVSIAIALILFLPLLFDVPIEEAVYRSVTLLVISCPCAFVLSVPLGYVVTIGHLSKQHILVKGSMAIERLNNLDILAVDKTGTLTTGEFIVDEFVNEGIYEDAYINSLVYSAEQNVTHPIAKSLVEYTAQSSELEIANLKQSAIGGVEFEYNNCYYKIVKGNARRVATVSMLYENDRLLATYYMKDTVKQDARMLSANLKELGIDLLMLTGDNDLVANDVASTLGIANDNVYSELLPEDKLNIVEKDIESGKVVGFVGDGLNDAAVIKRSDLGIAMGMRGSELSIDSSDVVLSDDKIGKIIDAIKISRYSNKIIKQNIIFAFTVKIIFIILGIVGITTMWEAVFSDVGVTLIAIINSMRIKRM